MKRLLSTLLVCSAANAHEMTPTYPTFAPSHVSGVLKTQLELFNRRADVEWYEVGVFDVNWQPIAFVSSYRLAKVEYLGRLKLEVYIKREDLPNAEYICTQSLLRRSSQSEPLVSSKICSRVKR